MNDFDRKNQFDINIQTYRQNAALPPSLGYAWPFNLAIKLSIHSTSISSPQTVSRYQ